MGSCREIRARNFGLFLGRSKDKGISYHVLEKSRLEEALAVIGKGFYTDEPACSLFKMSESAEAVREMNAIMTAVAKDGISVVAIDTQTKNIVGVCLNKFQIKPKPGELSFYGKFKREVSRNEKTINFLSYIPDLDEKVDVYETYNVESVVEIGFLAVAPTHRRRGIGQNLVSHSLELIKSKSTVACLIGTSKFTQHIGKKLKFEELYESPYEKPMGVADSVFQNVVKRHDRLILFAKIL